MIHKEITYIDRIETLYSEHHYYLRQSNILQEQFLELPKINYKCDPKVSSIIDKCDELLHSCPKRKEIQLYMGLALATCDEAIQLYANQAVFYYLKALGYFYLANEKYNDEIEPLLKKAEELDSKDARIATLRGLFNKGIGNKEKAIESFSKAIEIAPKIGKNYSYRGELKYEASDWLGALEDVQKGYLCRDTYLTRSELAEVTEGDIEIKIISKVQNAILNDLHSKFGEFKYTSCKLANGIEAKLVRIGNENFTFFNVKLNWEK